MTEPETTKTLRLRELVPEEKQYYHYHEDTGLLLANSGDYGWVAVSNHETVLQEVEELKEALNSLEEFIDPSTVLPLPRDYNDD
jgi:carbonic anhydrase